MKTILWNVDTQKDFMNPDGALYVPGAEEIKPNLAQITQIGRAHNMQFVNTGDWHNKNSKEISDTPNWDTTYPPHCMANTPGAEYIPETQPYGAGVVEWDCDKAQAILMYESDLFTVHDASELAKQGLDIIIYKDKFDVFAGNPHTDSILNAINPDRVIVYGVATNVCVDYAVRGLLERNKEVFVVEDAIKALPGKPSPVEDWYKQGAKKTSVKELEELLR